MIGDIKAKYLKMKPRERALVLALTAAVLSGMYVQAVYAPMKRKIDADKFQIKKLTARLEDFTMKLPDIGKQESNVAALKKRSEELSGEIDDISGSLPDKKSVSALVAELTRLAAGLDLTSVEQELDEGGEYSRLFVEIEFLAPYGQIIRYIRDICSISPFIKIEEMQIEERTGKVGKSGISAHIVVSSLLGERPFTGVLKAADEAKPMERVRDIFASRARPTSAIRKGDMVLEGITHGQYGATAIINDEVVRVGSKIGDVEVVGIRPDAVVLNDGTAEFELKVER